MVNLDLEDTIAALSSPPGPGARGVLRLSGPEVLPLLCRTFHTTDQQPLSKINRATRLGGYFHLAERLKIPCSVYYWPNARSYTGQPAAEIQLPGSPPLLESALTRLYQQGARPARPGEFTLRSFLAGHVDLVQAEAVLGVIDAADQSELKTALKQLAGGLSGRLKTLREELIELVADMEAGLDFVEEDIEFVSREEILARLTQTSLLVSEILEQTASRMTSRHQPRVILAGLPNAGKSTLFNALTGHAAALVSSEKGTTRDYLSHSLTWDNLSFELIDTAGWEESGQGSVQQNLMQQAHSFREELLKEADLVLWCIDSTKPENRSMKILKRFEPGFRKQLLVYTKADLIPHQPATSETNTTRLQVSAHAGKTLDILKSEIITWLSEQGTHEHQFLGTTTARTQASLASVKTALQQALAATKANQGDDMVAIDLHQAIDHLGEIVGAVYTEELLGRIFSKFCIGK